MRVERLPGQQQTQADGFFTDSIQVQPAAVVTEVNSDVIAFLAQVNRDQADGVFARLSARLRAFNAVGHAVAQQVLKGGRHAVEHAAVHLDGATQQVQPHLFAGFLRGQSHHAIKPV